MVNLNEYLPLIDMKKRTGELTDWSGKKQKSLLLADSFYRLDMKKEYTNVSACGTFLEFRRYTKEDVFKLANANFCKNRLCPLCCWRRSLKIFGQVSAIMDRLLAEKKYKFLFLTLSQKNVKGKDLGNEISRILKAFNRLTENKEFFQPIIKGYFRALEVTYNMKTDSYHPHLHILVAVDNTYGERKSKYISQNTLCELWQRYLKIDYKPVCHISLVKEKENKTINSVVAEVSKYTVKDTDYIFRNEDMTDKVVETLFNNLSTRRLVSFGGKFKELHKLLNLSDGEDDLVHIKEEGELREDLSYIIERYSWNIGLKQYFLVETEKHINVNVKFEGVVD